MFRRINRKTAAHIACCMVFVLVLSLFPAFPAQAASRSIEWGRFQNSETNNGITDAPTPANYQETALKWSRQMVQGYTTSFTPPLIIDGALYTASYTHVLKIDKDTGEVLKTSEELKLNVGYALNPITYDPDQDQLYVPILNGCVACLDFETLRVKWTSQTYAYTQTLSPITYRNGRVYTGLWAGETKESVYFCLDAKTGEELWHFSPSADGGTDVPCGFYWAGAYCTDQYLVFGSDDGLNNTFASSGDDSYRESATLFSVNSKTGKLIDKIEGCKGDIRSTAVYAGGYIYWTSKGGKLYKVAIHTDGTFDHASLSSYTTPDNGIVTASPVVYNGRIYLGAAGTGGQYSSDGGHMFAVIRDDEKLTQDSLIYTVPIPGFPQASPLLSTATEAEDGKVRLYFTFNAYPGGIYYLEDSPSDTADSHSKPRLLFRPESQMQQYCISPLCADSEGTLYIKNDSGYLMAVASNKVWLNDLTVSVGNDPVTKWDTGFESGTLNYRISLPNETESVYIRASAPKNLENVSMTIAGQKAAVDAETGLSDRIAVPISEEGASVPVTVTRTVAGQTYSRTYTLNLSALSNNANLAGFAVSKSNVVPKTIVDTAERSASRPSAEGTGKDTNGIGYDPSFDGAITEYVTETFGGNNAFINLWPVAADEKASVKVFPVENVANGGRSAGNKSCGSLAEDGSIPAMTTGKSVRYPVYWMSGEISATVRIEVTSPSEKTVKNYQVTLVRGEDHLDVGGIPLVLSQKSLSLSASGGSGYQMSASYAGEDVTDQCTFYSMQPAVASVDPYGYIAPGEEGSTVIWVSYRAGNITLRVSAAIDVSMPQAKKPEVNIAPGTYQKKKQIVLTTDSPGATIRYVTGSPDEALAAPTSTTGTVYEGPIAIGTDGESKNVLIRAIACGSGYKKSEVADFSYTIDLTGENGPDPDGPGEQTDPSDNLKYLDTSEGSGLQALTVPAGAGEKGSDTLTFPHGTSLETIIQSLSAMQITADLANGSREILDPSCVTWLTDSISYDPEYIPDHSFYIVGKVSLPDEIDAAGSSLRVRVKIQIQEGSVAPPQATPAPGTYTQDQKVALVSPTKGASVVYTTSESEETSVYRNPIILSAESTEKKEVEIRAYAIVNGQLSETVSMTYIIDKKTAWEKAQKEAAEKAAKEEYEKKAQTDLNNAVIATIADKTYTGKAIMPALTVKMGKTVLTAKKDYVVSFSNNKNAGKATVTITGIGKYHGKKQASFKIKKAATSVTLKNKTAVYTGKAIAGYKAVVKGSAGKVTYLYYSDAACKKAIQAAQVKNAGTYYYKATAAADKNHTAKTSAVRKLVIKKAAQPMTVKTVKKNVSVKKLKKKRVTVAGTILFSKKAQGNVTYQKITKGSDKKLSINKKTGVITVKKGTKKGKHIIRVSVQAAGNKNYLAGKRTAVITIQVKA